MLDVSRSESKVAKQRGVFKLVFFYLLIPFSSSLYFWLSASFILLSLIPFWCLHRCCTCSSALVFCFCFFSSALTDTPPPLHILYTVRGIKRLKRDVYFKVHLWWRKTRMCFCAHRCETCCILHQIFGIREDNFVSDVFGQSLEPLSQIRTTVFRTNNDTRPDHYSIGQYHLHPGNFWFRSMSIIPVGIKINMICLSATQTQLKHQQFLGVTHKSESESERDLFPMKVCTDKEFALAKCDIDVPLAWKPYVYCLIPNLDWSKQTNQTNKQSWPWGLKGQSKAG